MLPIEELKAETGLPVLVDGAQSVGAIAVDVTPFDYYTVSGQKWLCGPEGTGALFVADPERLRLASPTSFGFIHDARPDGSRAEARRGAVRHELGRPGPGRGPRGGARGGAGVALRARRSSRPAARGSGSQSVSTSITAPAQATLVTFRLDGRRRRGGDRLVAQGVVLRDLPGTGWLRASVGWWTSDEDVERLVAALPA